MILNDSVVLSAQRIVRFGEDHPMFVDDAKKLAEAISMFVDVTEADAAWVAKTGIAKLDFLEKFELLFGDRFEEGAVAPGLSTRGRVRVLCEALRIELQG